MEERKRPRMRSAVAAALAAVVAAGLFVATGAYSGWGNGGGTVRKAAPDLILYNGKISTVDPDNSTVQAVAIRDGEIIATGRSGRVRSLAKHSTQLLNLRGRRVLPGLIDATLHGIRTGYHCFSRTVALDTIFSRSQALSEFRRIAAQTPSGN